MIALPKGYRIFFATGPIDMRKAIDGLCALVVDALECNPQDKSLYLFYNKSRNKLKGIVWDGNGFMMIYKRLEKGRFHVPQQHHSGTLKLTKEELQWLLAGLDFKVLSRNPSLVFGGYA